MALSLDLGTQMKDSIRNFPQHIPPCIKSPVISLYFILETPQAHSHPEEWLYPPQLLLCLEWMLQCLLLRKDHVQIKEMLVIAHILRYSHKNPTRAKPKRFSVPGLQPATSL